CAVKRWLLDRGRLAERGGAPGSARRAAAVIPRLRGARGAGRSGGPSARVGAGRFVGQRGSGGERSAPRGPGGGAGREPDRRRTASPRRALKVGRPQWRTRPTASC